MIVGSNCWYESNVAPSSAGVLVMSVLMLWDNIRMSVVRSVGSGRCAYPMLMSVCVVSVFGWVWIRVCGVGSWGGVGCSIGGVRIALSVLGVVV